MTIGSWWTQQSEVSAVLANEESRNKFIQTIINLARAQDYDGMEIFIRPDRNDMHRFTLFLQVSSIIHH